MAGILKGDFKYISTWSTAAIVTSAAGIVVPAGLTEIRIDYDLFPNTGVMWIFLLAPNGSVANQTSRRNVSSVIDAIENTRLPLGGSLDANRVHCTGKAFLDVRAGASKAFKADSSFLLTTGIGPADHNMDTAGCTLDTARVSSFDIIGVTSGAGLANAIGAGSRFDLFGR